MIKTLIFVSFILGLTHAGYHAPLVATSYQNTVQISAAPVPIVVKAAPDIAAPVVYKDAEVYKAAPVLPSYAHPPALIKSPLLAAPLPYSYH